MPAIVGPQGSMLSSVSPLVGYVAHLRHLTNTKVAADLLRDKFRQKVSGARASATLLGSHVAQALDFHSESLSASRSTRPVLQYYSYLNLAVAVILAYRPPNFIGYKRHGVVDNTHSLNSLDLSSPVVTVRRGAVPLFHSTLSDVSLDGTSFRLGQLAAGFQLFHNELQAEFGKKIEQIQVTDRVEEMSGSFYSVFQFTAGGTVPRISSKKLEDAMPLLRKAYSRERKHVYRSVTRWNSRSKALRSHNANGMKLINFGGHAISGPFADGRLTYFWRGVSRVPLLPTLTSVLLLAFCLASVARYRPGLMQKAMVAPVYLLLDTFSQEADSVFIPAVRNLLYREEVAIGRFKYL